MSEPALRLATAGGGVRLEIRVMPRASRAALAGVRDGRLVVRVSAPPVEGAANDAAVEVLAHALDLPRQAVRIVAGGTSRNKTVAVAGVTETYVRERLR